MPKQKRSDGPKKEKARTVYECLGFEKFVQRTDTMKEIKKEETDAPTNGKQSVCNERSSGVDIHEEGRVEKKHTIPKDLDAHFYKWLMTDQEESVQMSSIHEDSHEHTLFKLGNISF